jgi:hypothetical protein
MQEEDFIYLEQATKELYEQTQIIDFQFALLTLRAAFDIKTKETKKFAELCLEYIQGMDNGLGFDRPATKLDIRLFKLEKFARNAMIASKFD